MSAESSFITYRQRHGVSSRNYRTDVGRYPFVKQAFYYYTEGACQFLHECKKHDMDHHEAAIMLVTGKGVTNDSPMPTAWAMLHKRTGSVQENLLLTSS